MHETVVSERKPLIAINGFLPKVKTTQGRPTTEPEQLLTIDDLAAHKQKLLSRQILYILIVINLIVLGSILLLT
ncbi:MAG: hypothetical protein JW837_17720 [Sedimentisphaerales bacterium]|nr:hypothetical protein [Sedimentisphaerales bacterium]